MAENLHLRDHLRRHRHFPLQAQGDLRHFGQDHRFLGGLVAHTRHRLMALARDQAYGHYRACAEEVVEACRIASKMAFSFICV